MILKDMFLKDIERDIRGVIKVSQVSEADIYQELDEYVVTQELNKHFSKLYEQYLKGIEDRTDKMGVWISGFFGSGKSHFLKILSYLLENKAVQGKKPVDFFKEKIEDPLVYDNMKRATQVNTETILFNIDSKSSINNKSKEDAILRVFTKVFYEHRGYYGDIPGVAEMEKYLDKQGLYERFKREFQVLASDTWENRRNSFYFDEDFVVGALTKVTNMSEKTARNWFESGVNNFELSIEKFAKDVKEYIDEKGPNFHLVFLVDEIGQYIGDNRNLMLNLQTLAEDLGTYAGGKVWIIVTSQENIDSIVKVKGDDFSRIQGRFDTRLSLSSVSVDEVIIKRILQKKAYVNDKLKLLYPEKSAILKNLISFRESTADFKGYSSEKEFAEVYPFVPYQFKLLQKVFEQVRKHGSSGKHLSEGERSMLSAFKEASFHFKEAKEGTLIPFYAFYDTIKEFLNPSISRVIEGANENPVLNDDSFNIELLKVLFMIKYIKELPANIDNISTLMVTDIDEDKLQLKEKIKNSLRKLVSQTLIQKNGDSYLFLTDDEQDINREIKQIDVDRNIVKRELANYIFQDLYDNKRFNYSNEYAFTYNQKMDEKNYGNQTSSIGLQILSPLSDYYPLEEQEIMMKTLDSGELLIKLGGNKTYIEEMEEALRIEEYRKKKSITQLPENIQNILNNKQVELRERRRKIRGLLEDAIKDGSFFVNGDKIETTGSNVKEKINSAFKQLVDNVYIKLNYVKEHLGNEQQLIKILESDDIELSFDNSIGTNPNELAKKEVYEFIDMQSQIQKQNRINLIYERFQDKPYGWKQLDIAGLIAKLLKEQRIRIRYNSEYLEPKRDTNQLLKVFRKINEADRGIVLKRVKVDEKLIRKVRNVCRDIFNTTDLADDEDGLIKGIRKLIEKQISEIEVFKARYEGKKYPGLSLLNKGLEYFEQFDNKLDNASFFNKLIELEKHLADWEDDMVYIKSFFETEQKDIFEQGLAGLLRYEENKTYLSEQEVIDDMEKLRSIVQDPIPYRKIKDIPELLHSLETQLCLILKDKKENAQKRINLDHDELSIQARQNDVPNKIKQRVDDYYAELKNNLVEFTDIFKVDATISQSASYKEKMLTEINREIMKQKNVTKQNEQINEGSQIIEPRNSIVQKYSVRIADLVPVTTLSTEEDIDKYINTLSHKLKQIIKSNKKIEFIE